MSIILVGKADTAAEIVIGDITASHYMFVSTNPSGDNEFPEYIAVDELGVPDPLTIGDLTVTSNISVAGVEETFVASVLVNANPTPTVLNIDTATILQYLLRDSNAAIFTMPVAASSNGRSFTLFLRQAATTVGTATFTGVDWGGAGTYSVTATLNKIDILSFVCMNSKWYGSVAKGFDP